MFVLRYARHLEGATARMHRRLRPKVLGTAPEFEVVPTVRVEL